MRGIPGPAMIALNLLLSIAALAVGGTAYLTARQLRQGLLEAVVQVRAAVSSVSTQTLEIPIRIQETFPIQARIPIQEEVAVPIQTVLPISTEVKVPINVPLLGERWITIPIQANVPIDLEIIIPISRTVDIETSLAVDTEVPVGVDLMRIGLEGMLRELDARLEEVERHLR